MAKLHYWVSLGDGGARTIRAKSFEGVQHILNGYRDEPELYDRFSAPEKVCVEYNDAFDLLNMCLDGEIDEYALVFS